MVHGHFSVNANPRKDVFDNPADWENFKSGLIVFDEFYFARAVALRRQRS